jgi:predicted TIM-barrel fold metal-dependent hydrolase
LRAAQNPNLRTGLKLHFGNSDVDVDSPKHVAQLRRVFRAANQNGMAIVAHIRPTISRNRPYGAKQARIFVEQLLPEAPDVTIQIAHLAGGGGYDDPAIDEAVAVFAERIAQNDPRMKNIYFDISGVAGLGNWKSKAELVAKRMRQLGLSRLLYGSDAAIAGNLPIDTYKRWRLLPLSEDEFRTIEANVAPYVRKWPLALP